MAGCRMCRDASRDKRIDVQSKTIVDVSWPKHLCGDPPLQAYGFHLNLSNDSVGRLTDVQGTCTQSQHFVTALCAFTQGSAPSYLLLVYLEILFQTGVNEGIL